MKFRRFRQHCLGRALCLTLLVPGAVIQAQPQQAALHYDIPAGPLGRNLSTVAAEAGIALAFDPALTQGRSSPAIQGRYAPLEALNTLLAGHDLVLEAQGDGSYRVMKRDGHTTLPPVKVSAAALIAPGTDAVVEGDSLSRYQANDLEDVFSQQPEVSVGGSIGIAQKVYVRGFEDTLLNVSVDGASQGARLFHHTGRLTIEPELLKRVEVEAGAGAATSGPGALGGAVRFITKDPEDLLKPGEVAGGLVKLGYFSNTQGYQANTTVFGRASERWSGMLSLSQSDHDRIEDGNGDDLVGTESEQQMGFAKVVGKLSAAQTLRVSYDLRRDDGERNQRPQWVSSDFNPVYELELERETVTANYQFTPAGNPLVDFSATLYRTESNLEQNVFDRWGRYIGEGESVGGDIRNTSVLGRHNLTYGVDYRQDDVQAGSASASATEQEDAEITGIYWQDRFTVSERIELGLGLRYDDYQLTGNDGLEYDDSDLSPSADVRVQVNPAVAVYAGYAEAFRGPLSPDAFKLEGASRDPDLQAEEAKNTEVGVEVEVDNVQFNAKLYRSEIDNAIADPVGRPAIYQNIGDLESEGVLLQLATQWRRVHADLSLHHNTAEVEGEQLNAYDHSGLGNSIGNTAILNLGYIPSANLEMGWSARLVEGIDDLKAAPGKIDKPGYGVHDIYATWRPLEGDVLTLTLTIKNLLDKQYLDHASNGDFQHIEGYQGIVGLPEAGRDVRLGLAWRF